MASVGGSRSVQKSGGASAPMVNAAFIVGALALGLWVLASRRQAVIPDVTLWRKVGVLAGALGLVGPFILGRGSAGSSGLGEFAWFVVGALLWIQNFALLTLGNFRLENAPQAVSAQQLGFVCIAAMVAGWRLQGARGDWKWTNVLGWGLALVWVGHALLPLLEGLRRS